MTNDKQVEVWRKEFEAGKSESAIQRDYRKPELYWNDPVQHQWEGFLLAKRSMQPIELPKNYYSPDNFDVHGAAVEAFDSAIDDCKRAITSAGYRYTVK